MELKAHPHTEIMTLVNRRKPSKLPKQTLEPKLHQSVPLDEISEFPPNKDGEMFEVIKR